MLVETGRKNQYGFSHGPYGSGSSDRDACQTARFGVLTAEKEVAVMENGKTVKKKVPATQIDPGNILFYTVSYINSGGRLPRARLLMMQSPKNGLFPREHLGENADITFSINRGKTLRNLHCSRTT